MVVVVASVGSSTDSPSPAVVLPGFAYVVVRDLEGYLLEKAAMLEAVGSPAGARVAHDIRQSLTWIRPVHAEVARRIQGAVAPLTSDDGSTELPGEAPGASSDVPPGGPGLTTGEVAAMLRVGPRQVVNLIGSKRLAATRRGPGHPWVITKAALDDYVVTWRSRA